MRKIISVTKASGRKRRAGDSRENSFVYMLLCQDGYGPIYVKVGTSDAPLRRFRQLRGDCPVPPRRIAMCSVPSRVVARRVELQLSKEFAPWRERGRWFLFGRRDKNEFNAAWQRAFRCSAPRGWPLEWSHLPVALLLEKWAVNRRFVQRLLKSSRPPRSTVRLS